MTELFDPPKDGTQVLAETDAAWYVVRWDGEHWYDETDNARLYKGSILSFWALPPRTSGRPFKTPLPVPDPPPLSALPPGEAFRALDRVGAFSWKSKPTAPAAPPPTAQGVGEDHVMLFGKYKDRTLSWILDKNPGYIVWLDAEEALGIHPDLVKRAESRQLRMRASREYYSRSSYTDHTREYDARELRRMLEDEREARYREEDRRRVSEEMYRINGPDCPPGCM
jgi:hypothetical protein